MCDRPKVLHGGDRICERCGDRFTPKKRPSGRYKGMYCSRKCHRDHISAAAKRRCIECGESFKPSNKGGKLCSVRCRDSAKMRLTHNLEAGTKRCALCAEWQPFECFSWKKRRGGKALQAYCRKCHAKKSVEYSAENPGRIKENARLRRRANPDKYSDQHREYCTKNRERVAELQRNWRRANPETVRLMNKARLHRQRAIGYVGRSTVLELRRLQKGLCAYCRSTMEGSRNEHLDHIQPISSGGDNNQHNLQLLCQSCNLRKSSHDPIDFAQRDGRLL